MKNVFLAVAISFFSFSALAWERPTLNALDDHKMKLDLSTVQAPSNIKVKLKDDLNRTLKEVHLDQSKLNDVVFNLQKLPYGTYHMDVFHQNLITRKTIEVAYDQVKVVAVVDLKREIKPYTQWAWHPFHEH